MSEDQTRAPSASEQAQAPRSDADGAAPELDVKAAWELVAQEIHAKLMQLVQLFAPGYPDEYVAKTVDTLVEEQRLYQERVMPTLLDRARREQFERIAIEIMPIGPMGKPQGNAFHLPCPKRPIGPKGPNVRDPEAAFSWAVLLMFIMSPEVRGMLRLSGFAYQLREVQESRIIMPGR